ncbi:MAG: GatB/YqeY domain-containing protein [Nitrospinota bacterium]|nr:GatB/YqeY domain-containing protein [Nitrospinota bacterium]
MSQTRQKLENDMKDAMRSKDQLKLSTIRMIRSEILNKDKENGKEIDEDAIIKILENMLKKREEAESQFRDAGREDLADKEKEESIFIKNYLPEQMTDEEIQSVAESVVSEQNASSMKDIGKVMPILTKELAGRANGSRISNIVKNILNG